MVGKDDHMQEVYVFCFDEMRCQNPMVVMRRG